jgi:hypothetical protein
MVGCGQEVAAELEEVVDLAMAGEEPLGMPRRLEPLHLPFSPPRRLVRDFGAVVEIAVVNCMTEQIGFKETQPSDG